MCALRDRRPLSLRGRSFRLLVGSLRQRLVCGNCGEKCCAIYVVPSVGERLRMSVGREQMPANDLGKISDALQFAGAAKGGPACCSGVERTGILRTKPPASRQQRGNLEVG